MSKIIFVEIIFIFKIGKIIIDELRRLNLERLERLGNLEIFLETSGGDTMFVNWLLSQIEN